MSTTVTITPMIEDRTVRNLIHSDRVVAQSVDSLVIDGVRLQCAVLDRAGGEVHEDLLQGRALRRELEDSDTGVKGQLPDLVRRQPRDRQAFVARVVDDALVSTVTIAASLSWSDARASTVPSAFFVRSFTEPDVMKRPRPMTMISSAETAISLMRCELTKTVRPSLASARKKSRIHLMPSGSSPFTGSSKNRIPGITEERSRRCRGADSSQGEGADLLIGDGADAHEVEHLVDARTA